MGGAHLISLLGVIVAGVLIRWVLFQYGFTGILNQSYEIVTPVTSYERCASASSISPSNYLISGYAAVLTIFYCIFTCSVLLVQLVTRSG